jgi:hypothetical protein
MIPPVKKPFAILKWQLVIILAVLPMTSQVDGSMLHRCISSSRHRK